jgi:hypothetical protein
MNPAPPVTRTFMLEGGRNETWEEDVTRDGTGDTDESAPG